LVFRIFLIEFIICEFKIQKSSIDTLPWQMKKKIPFGGVEYYHNNNTVMHGTRPLPIKYIFSFLAKIFIFVLTPTEFVLIKYHWLEKGFFFGGSRRVISFFISSAFLRWVVLFFSRSISE